MKIIFTVLFLVVVQVCNAQSSSCENLIKNKERDQQQIDELGRQVAYYKNLLHTTKAIRSATYEDIRYDIQRVRGLRKDGTILIEFTYQNMDEGLMDALQVEKAVIVEPLGKRFQTTQVSLTADGRFRAVDLVPGVPYKALTVMRKTSADFPTMRTLVLYIFPRDNISSPEPVIFENVPVVWE